MSYVHLAAVYDALMADTPYPQWLEWADAFWQKTKRPRTILDLGCGTGSIAIPLARQGYTVFGLDLSEEMLAIAYEKMQQARVQVTWTRQDMRDFSVQPVDCVLSFCDSSSYLLEEDDVKQMYRHVYDHLEPNGWFLFDVHSPAKILDGYGDNTFTWVEDDLSYIWQCVHDPLLFEVEHQLTFFLKEQNGLYRRLEEVHVQRAYHLTSHLNWLREAGFTDITVTADFTNLPPQAHSERLFFTAHKA